MFSHCWTKCLLHWLFATCKRRGCENYRKLSSHIERRWWGGKWRDARYGHWKRKVRKLSDLMRMMIPQIFLRSVHCCAFFIIGDMVSRCEKTGLHPPATAVGCCVNIHIVFRAVKVIWGVVSFSLCLLSDGISN
jgi:hypothetical protein